MRLGLLGPAQGDPQTLERAARFLRRELEAERVVYLGVDGALDRVVESWAEQLVGEHPEDAALCRRATARCLRASPEEIDAYVAREQERARLRMFESLPGERTRSVELFAGRVAVMIHDKAFLDEEDILPTTWLMFGASPTPLVKRIGRRWFLSPGCFPEGGVMLLEDAGGLVRVSWYSGALEELGTEQLGLAREVNLRVSGEG
jgi:hypothetical protein